MFCGALDLSLAVCVLLPYASHTFVARGNVRHNVLQMDTWCPTLLYPNQKTIPEHSGAMLRDTFEVTCTVQCPIIRIAPKEQ